MTSKSLMKSFRFPLLLLAIMMINSDHYGVLATGYQTSDQSSKGGGGYANNNDDLSSPANYMFEYGIDDHYGPMLSHNEERNGHQTRGRYSVLLPDGKRQTVSYWADATGYHADVSYEPSQSGAYGPSPTASVNPGNSDGGYGGGGGGYENVQTQASSYSQHQQPSLPTQKSNGGYVGKGTTAANNGHGSLSRKGNSKSFVKFRRTDNGRTFNYAY